MVKKLRQISLILMLSIGAMQVQGQEQENPVHPALNFKSGIGFVAPDSLYSLNFRFRMQARAGYKTVSESNFSANEFEARIRRLRLRFEGFMLRPEFTYYIQLSFSRGDMDWTDNENSAINSSPNVVRDAIVMYKPTDKLTFTFGQTKLPGNRQRVVSSSELQFYDRSLVNSTFNIDRDFGLQADYNDNIGWLDYVLKGAISSGEGRNSVASDAGLAYTGRVEVLPFGKFTNKGDYFEGDLEREPSPKLSVAGGFHHNESAERTNGTTGRDLYENRDLNSFIADMLFKYRGFALTAEFINRNARSPVTRNDAGQERFIYVGQGKMVQASYLFKNNVELAGRYAIVSPFSTIQDKAMQREEMILGTTKYLRKHRVKLHGNLIFNRDTNLFLNQTEKNWVGMFQIEFGI